MKREARKNRQRKSGKDIYHVEMAEEDKRSSESSVSVSDFIESAASDKEGEKLTCTIRFSDLRADGGEFDHDEEFRFAEPQSISLTRAMKPSQSPKGKKSASAN